jgi:ABC-type phosphate transport system permease subunit
MRVFAQKRERWIVALLIFAPLQFTDSDDCGHRDVVVTETYSFFGQYDWRFFFSTTWSPNFRGGSDLGIIPLIWDTLYIGLSHWSLRCLWAVRAVYLSEYAPRMRSCQKSCIEVLAGIPTNCVRIVRAGDGRAPVARLFRGTDGSGPKRVVGYDCRVGHGVC